MRESFYLSNMAPQVGVGMNRGVWKNIEVKVRQWANEKGSLFVITGPVFQNEKPLGFIGGNNIAIPTHFYKIILDRNRNQIISFVVPNQDVSNQPISNFVSSLRQVKQMTGLIFFPEFKSTSVPPYYIESDWRLK